MTNLLLPLTAMFVGACLGARNPARAELATKKEKAAMAKQRQTWT